MFIEIISFFGLVIGYILAEKFKSELKDIKKFLQIISLAAVIFIILKLIYDIKPDLLILIGIILGLLINYFLKNNYLYFGSILAINSINDLNKMFFSILIFIFGLVNPALNNISKKKIIISFILFIIPLILLYKNFLFSVSNFVVGFSIGGLAIGLARSYK
jgi:hypothetical protein